MSSQKPRLAPPVLWGVVLSAMVFLLSACASTPPAALRGTGDLGVVIERADGRVKIVETSGRSVLATV
ncbi:MAG TPA: protein nirF, partial [Thauera sp.]|nr:protein nirF [Thauera sp.]